MSNATGGERYENHNYNGQGKWIFYCIGSPSVTPTEMEQNNLTSAKINTHTHTHLWAFCVHLEMYTLATVDGKLLRQSVSQTMKIQ